MREDDVMAKWAAKRNAAAGTLQPIGQAVAGLAVVRVTKTCLGCGRSWEGNAFSKDITTGWCDECIDNQEAADRQTQAAPKHYRPTVQELRAPKETDDAG